MPNIQETILYAIHTSGAEILRDKALFLSVLEDLNPVLSEDIDFLWKFYPDDIGEMLYRTYTGIESDETKILVYLEKIYTKELCERLWTGFEYVLKKQTFIVSTGNSVEEAQKTHPGKTNLEKEDVPGKDKTGEERHLGSGGFKGKILDYFIDLDEPDSELPENNLPEVPDTKEQNKANDAISNKHTGSDAVTLYNLGMHYMQGEKTEKNIKKAFYNFQTSADCGYVPALTALGNIYYDGYVFGKDYRLASLYYKRAADLGDIDAMECLAKIYDEGGFGVKKSSAWARYWTDKVKIWGYKRKKNQGGTPS